ncbi:MAG TPA: hypothetical protein VFS35_01160, partial [Terrimicrobiaceae bacterium]|nr:hypothetical protein [Terrimicrobiaceae bacterium]
MNAIAKHLGILTGNTGRPAATATRRNEIRPPFRLVAVVGLILALSAVLRAEDGVKVTDLMTKDLADIPGKEVAMITVDYAPG